MTLDPLVIALLERFSLPLAGALGGLIRWISVQSHWRAGLGHVAIGAIIGNYFGPAVLTFIQPAADFSGMLPADAAALGAHIAGAFGINIYTIPADLIRGRHEALKASLGKD